MGEEEIRTRLDTVIFLVVASTSRINYLLQILDLFEDKNRIVLRLVGFYNMAVRDFGSAAIISTRALHEKRGDTHNLHTLIEVIKNSTIPNEKRVELEPILAELAQLAEEKLPRDVTVLASITHAHKSLKLPKTTVAVRYADLRDHLYRVGDLLNKISGVLWNSATLMHFPDSEGDGFKKKMEHIELAEDIGTWMMRLHEDHECVAQRKAFIKNMKENKDEAKK